MASNESGNGNGNGAAHAAHTASLHIEMDLCTHTLKVNAQTPNLDCALSMLAATTRAIEAQLRQQQALEFAARQQRAAQDAQISAMVRGGKV
ncbi:MAG: hypothetical protein LAN64_16615 [Acidobacteriia bacterium]|nr:hypothetical protein [Terriglobia bacterium]